MKRNNLYKVFIGRTRVDRQLTMLLQSHANLIVAFMIVGMIVRLHTVWLIAGIFITGLFTYFGGASMGLLSSLIICGLRFHGWAIHGFPDLSHIVLEAIGYWCTIWLAHQHHKQTVQNSHRDQIMPWTVANEIRNSLAGIRFVLFPLYGNSMDTEIQRVTDEITKLEHLFEEIEQENLQTR